MGKKVLIVEDNPVNLELATDLLELANYNVLSAQTAEEGIEIAKAELPDLILMDVRLPNMDGLEAIKILKRDDKTSEIPVVCLTAYAMPGDKEKALEAGSDGYITKPIDTSNFVSQIDKFFAP